MEQILRVTPVVGLPQFDGWSHVWDNNLDPQTKFVLCFAISGDNASNIGRDLVEHITQMPPRSSQGLYQMMEECISLTGNQGGTITLSAGLFRSKRLIVATYNGLVVLKRGQKVGRIVQSDAELQIIEGKFETDDVFIFSTDAARQFIPQVELSFQRGYDSDGVITAIVPALHSLDDSSTAALAFVAVTEEDTSVSTHVSPSLEIDIQASPSESNPLISIERDQTTEHSIPTSEVDRPLESSVLDDRVTVSVDRQVQAPKASVIKKIGQAALNIFSLIQALLKKIVTFSIQLKNSFSSRTYVGAPPRKNVVRWLIAIVTAVVIVGIGVWIIRSRLQQAESRAQEVAAPFRTQISEVRTAADNNPIPARESAAALIETIKTAMSEAESARHTRTVEELELVLVEAQDVYQDISGRDEVADLPLFYDLRLVTSDFISSGAASNQSLAIFIDDEKKEAIVLNLTTKQVFKLDLRTLAGVKSFVAFGENEILLLANGVHSAELAEGAMPRLIKEEGDSNRNASLVASFGSYVYVFNPEKRNIYRYVQEGEAYSDPVGWLLDPLGVPFDSVTSWAIDGDMWIGTDTGSVLKFASGRSEDFEIIGLPEPFESSLQVVTRESLENLYILEAAMNRIVVLTKEGQFLRELKSSSLGAATSLLVDQSGTKAYVVSGSTVFEVDI